MSQNNNNKKKYEKHGKRNRERETRKKKQLQRVGVEWAGELRKDVRSSARLQVS